MPILPHWQDVLFGDIWVCSGQSNMEWPMQSIINAEEEIADIATFDNIR
jgi:sialate O-acetylesterase